MESVNKEKVTKVIKRATVKKRRKSIFGMLRGKIFCDDAIFNLEMKKAWSAILLILVYWNGTDWPQWPQYYPHAIADKRILISVDEHFALYENAGLKFWEV